MQCQVGRLTLTFPYYGQLTLLVQIDHLNFLLSVSWCFLIKPPSGLRPSTLLPNLVSGLRPPQLRFFYILIIGTRYPRVFGLVGTHRTALSIYASYRSLPDLITLVFISVIVYLPFTYFVNKIDCVVCQTLAKKSTSTYSCVRS